MAALGPGRKMLPLASALRDNEKSHCAYRDSMVVECSEKPVGRSRCDVSRPPLTCMGGKLAAKEGGGVLREQEGVYY